MRTANLISIPLGTLVASVTLAGCSTASKDITSTYVSPLQYQAYDCGQIESEMQRVEARVTQVGGRLDNAASNDKKLTGAGLVLFWPALFFLGGTKEQEAEYGRLKGEYEAIQQASNAKKCQAATNEPPKPAAPVEASGSAPA